MTTKWKLQRKESGALLLILMVGVAVMSIGLGVAAQAWSATWQRDSEEELIFRANQYVDAILAYRKDHAGQFPTNLDDLMKLGPRHVRYIRKLFKDPLNPGGKWGLLYLMPGGQGIYDAVAAQRAMQSKDANGSGGDGDQVVTTGMAAGVTPITPSQNGNGNNQPGLNQGKLQGFGQSGGFGGQGGGGGLQSNLANALGMSQLQQSPGLGSPLMPPKPVDSSFDEESASEPPIGWPIVGVISRVDSKKAAKTFKIYRGHDKADDWQFHVFDRGSELLQAPPGVVPGGSASPFVGPGYGGYGAGAQGGRSGPAGGAFGGGGMGGNGGGQFGGGGPGPRVPGQGLFPKGGSGGRPNQ
jgi:type II secretory pathway pseudopilin PulG